MGNQTSRRMRHLQAAHGCTNANNLAESYLGIVQVVSDGLVTHVLLKRFAKTSLRISLLATSVLRNNSRHQLPILPSPLRGARSAERKTCSKLCHQSLATTPDLHQEAVRAFGLASLQLRLQATSSALPAPHGPGPPEAVSTSP